MKQSNNVKAAIYCRVADGMDNPYAIRNQEREVYAFAKENGYTVCGFYSDNGYNGLSVERPALQRMIADIESGMITHVVVKDLSRLFRNSMLLLWFYSLCDHYDVVVRTIGPEYTHDEFMATLQRFVEKVGVAT